MFEGVRRGIGGFKGFRGASKGHRGLRGGSRREGATSGVEREWRGTGESPDSLLELYEDNNEEDEPPPEGVSEPEGGVQLSSNDPAEPDLERADSDRIFVANIHPFATPQSICAVQTVSQLLADTPSSYLDP